ncbi:MAG: HAMP domain-containing sensor histidine kinase [Anaerolineales bacterium]
MMDTLPNDPISNLPEPYRLAWEVFQDSDGYENVLRKVLTSAKKLADADWVMLVVNNDSSKFSPGFYCLPDTSNITVPVGDIASLAYALAMHVIENPRHILIENINETTNIDSDLLIKTYISAETRDHYVKMVREGHMWRPFLETTDLSPFTCMVIPAQYGENVFGAFYLHRTVMRESFDKEILNNLSVFIKNITLVIKKLYDVENMRRLYFQQLAVLSSEIRTPITSIEGFATILRDHPQGIEDDLGENTVTENEFLDYILNSTKYLKDLLNYILLEAKLNNNLKEEADFNLYAVVEEVIKGQDLMADSRPYTLEIALSDEINVDVTTSVYLVSIIGFLMKNLKSYLFPDEHIKISAYLEDNFFVFYVASDNDMPKISLKHLHESSLFIKKAIEISGGQIGSDNPLNQYNSFWFRLPVIIKE